MAKLSPQQIDQIEAFAAKGKSGIWISNRLDLPNATVNYRMLRAGFDPWPGKSRNSLANHPGAFSAAEDALLLELGQTHSMNSIAIMMNRPPTSVRIRLMTLEVRAEKAIAS